MKMLLLKAAGLVAAVLLTLAVFFMIPGAYENPLATIINKLDHLKKTAPPRILLTGGSEVFIGVNSAMMHRETGMNLANMGLYVGFGVRDILHFIRPEVSAGDIIIMIPDYYTLEKKGVASDDFTHKWLLLLSPRYALVNVYTEQKRLMDLPGDISDLFMCKMEGMWKTLWKGKNMFFNGVAFFRESTNEFGDPVRGFKILPRDRLSGFGHEFPVKRVSPDLIRELKDFADYARSRGAKVYYSFPAYPDGEYLRNRAGIDAMTDECLGKTGITPLGTPSDFTFPYECFSDTIHHLRNECRDTRTKKLVEFLKNAGAVPRSDALRKK